MTILKAVHLKEDTERLYVSRKKGGRGLVSIEDCVDISTGRFEDFIKKELK